jgi:nitrous oxide reductase accessory protein NosL
MKTKLFAILLVLAAAGCSRTPDSMIAAHAAIDNDVRCQYSGADLNYTVINGQVFEYGTALPATAERKPAKAAKMVFAVLDGQVFEY